MMRLVATWYSSWENWALPEDDERRKCGGGLMPRHWRSGWQRMWPKRAFHEEKRLPHSVQGGVVVVVVGVAEEVEAASGFLRGGLGFFGVAAVGEQETKAGEGRGSRWKLLLEEKPPPLPAAAAAAAAGQWMSGGVAAKSGGGGRGERILWWGWGRREQEMVVVAAFVEASMGGGGGGGYVVVKCGQRAHAESSKMVGESGGSSGFSAGTRPVNGSGRNRSQPDNMRASDPTRPEFEEGETRVRWTRSPENTQDLDA